VWILWTCVLWYLVYIFNSSIFWDTRRWIKSKSTIRSRSSSLVIGKNNTELPGTSYELEMDVTLTVMTQLLILCTFLACHQKVEDLCTQCHQVLMRVTWHSQLNVTVKRISNIPKLQQIHQHIEVFLSPKILVLKFPQTLCTVAFQCISIKLKYILFPSTQSLILMLYLYDYLAICSDNMIIIRLI